MSEFTHIEDSAPTFPDLPLDDSGIPTFVFSDRLCEADRPRTGQSVLEVRLYWGTALLAVRHLDESKWVTVGSADDNDFAVFSEQLVEDPFVLAEPDETGPAVSWLPTMQCEIRRADGAVDAMDHVRTSALGFGERAAMQLGELTFVVERVGPARVRRVSLWRTIDLYFTKVLSLSAVGHVAMVLMLLLTPISPEEIDYDDLPRTLMQLDWPTEAEPPPEAVFELPRQGGQSPGDAGRIGEPRAKRKSTAAGKGDPKFNPNDTGILKLLGAVDGESSRILTAGGLPDLDQVSSGLTGRSLGHQRGTRDMTTRGSGSGGEGTSIGFGMFGGPGTGPGSPLGKGPALSGRDGTPVAPPERTEALACVNKEEVRRVLQRLESRARACYEASLQSNPNLEGKVITRFEIDGAGRARRIRISLSTLGDRGVHACLQRVLTRQPFPPCEGGGVADITHSWLFKSR